MLFTKIGSSYSSTQFPERFSNQLFFSENVALGEYTYKSSYSIKFVLSGFENYLVEGREIHIKQGQHLIVNNNSEVTTLPSKGKAISIFIAPETLSDVINIIDSSTIEKNLGNYYSLQPKTILFHEKSYHAENVYTNQILRRIAKYLSKGLLIGNHEIDPALFFQLSKALIFDQKDHSSRLSHLNCQKSSTIQEQYKRLLMGWQYLNDQWNQPFSLTKTASVSTLSPFHFHRLFKACFSMTPYQYHLKIQMEKAIELLKKNKYSISEITYLLGFGSTTSFGRTFKQYFGMPPSSFMK